MSFEVWQAFFVATWLVLVSILCYNLQIKIIFMDTPGPPNYLKIGTNGRIDINELKGKLTLPSNRWILDSGGGNSTAYMWFVGPANFDVREITEIHQKTTGKPPLKYDKNTEIKDAHYGINIQPGECWFLVELSPTIIDLSLIQTFIDELAQRISPLAVPAAIQPLEPVDEVRGEKRAWWRRLFGL